MVYPVAAELFAAHLSDVVGESFFRADDPRYDPHQDARDTPIATKIEP
jgi:hypothetical protein